MQKISLILCLSVSCLLTISCAREAEERSSVTIEIPNAVQSKIAAYSATEFDDYEDDDDKGWSSFTPTGLDDGSNDLPINCYAVMVSGPEAYMQNSMCGRQAENAAGDNYIDFKEGELYNFHVGQWAGLTSTGGSLVLDVDAGPDRVFTLIGFHVQGNDALSCSPIGIEIDREKFSRPYVVAQSAPMSLTGGQEVSPEMTMSFDANNWFDSCDGPAFDDGDHKPVASQIRVVSHGIIDNTFVQGECTPLEVFLSDDQGHHADLPEGTQQMSVELLSSTLGPLSTWPNPDDCASGSASQSTSFTLTAAQPETVRWVKVISSECGMVGLANACEITPQIIAPTNIALLPINTQFGHFLGTNTATYKLIGPQAALQGSLIKYTLFSELIDGSPRPAGGSSAIVEMSISNTQGLNPNINVFSVTAGGACDTTTPIPESSGNYTLPAIAPGDNHTVFCLQLNSNAGLPQVLTFFENGDNFSPSIMSGTAIIDNTAEVIALGGSHTVVEVDIIGPKNIGRPGSTGTICHGPYYVVAKNEFGTMVNLTEPTSPSNVQLKINDDSAVSFHTEDFAKTECHSSTSISNITDVNFDSNFLIPQGFFGKPFYFKVDNTTMTGDRVIRATLEYDGASHVTEKEIDIFAVP